MQMHKSIRLIIISLFVIVVIILLWLLNQKDSGRVEYNAVNAGQQEQIQNHNDTTESGSNVVLNGLNDKGEPYKIFAERVIKESENHITLSQVRGTLNIQDGRIIYFSAGQGVVYPAKKQLELQYNVVLKISNDEVIKGRRVSINYGNNTAYSADNVTMTNTLGRIKGTGFNIPEHKSEEIKIIVHGKVKTLIKNVE